jgi:hypothetical protein
MKLGSDGLRGEPKAYLLGATHPLAEIALLASGNDVVPGRLASLCSGYEVVERESSNRTRPVAILATVAVAEIDVLARKAGPLEAAALG